MNSLQIKKMLNRVPEVTIYFWIIKILCTTEYVNGFETRLVHI